MIKVYNICHSQQCDQGLHYLPFSAVWSRSTLFAIFSNLIGVYTIGHSQQSGQGHGIHYYFQEQSDQDIHNLPFEAVWSKSTLFAILSSVIRVYTTCHSQQSDQGQHYLPFLAILSGSTLLGTLSSLVKAKVYTIIFRNSLIRIYTICHLKQSDQSLHCLPFTAVWSGSALFAILSSLIKIYTVCHSQQSEQGLHYLPFSTVWSGSTLFAILSSLIRV